MYATEVRTKDGRLVGWIERCRHGSRFIQAKIVPPGACVNSGNAHRCVEKSKAQG